MDELNHLATAAARISAIMERGFDVRCHQAWQRIQ